MRRQNLAALCFALVAGGCDTGGGGTAPQGGSAEPDMLAVVSERRPLEAAPRATRVLGESCTSTGAAGCAEDVCLKVGADRGRGYACSRHCKNVRDGGWAGLVYFVNGSYSYTAPSSLVETGKGYLPGFCYSHSDIRQGLAYVPTDALVTAGWHTHPGTTPPSRDDLSDKTGLPGYVFGPTGFVFYRTQGPPPLAP